MKLYVGNIDLAKTDLELLEQLRERGSATATDLAVRVRVLTDAIRPTLERLQEKGLVESKVINNAYDRQLYSVSPAGHSVLGSFPFV